MSKVHFADLNFSYNLHYMLFQNFLCSDISINVPLLSAVKYPNPSLTIFLINKIKTKKLLKSLLNISYLYMTLSQLPFTLKTTIVRWKNWRKKHHYHTFAIFKGRSFMFFRFIFLATFFLFPFWLRDGFLPSYFGHLMLQSTLYHPVIYHPFYLFWVQPYLQSRLMFRITFNFMFQKSLQRVTSLIYLNFLRFFNWPLVQNRAVYSVDWERQLFGLEMAQNSVGNGLSEILKTKSVVVPDNLKKLLDD